MFWSHAHILPDILIFCFLCSGAGERGVDVRAGGRGRGASIENRGKGGESEEGVVWWRTGAGRISAGRGGNVVFHAPEFPPK